MHLRNNPAKLAQKSSTWMTDSGVASGFFLVTGAHDPFFRVLRSMPQFGIFVIYTQLNAFQELE
jgi:hypothetical protein